MHWLNLLQCPVLHMRVQVRADPVHVRLDQDVLTYLMGFGAQLMSPTLAHLLKQLEQLQLAAASGGAAPVLPYFQHVEVVGTHVTLDYRPRRVDVTKLKVGSSQADP